jgi:hypothetical protein
LARVAWVLAARRQRAVVVVDLPENAVAVVFEAAEVVFPVPVVVRVKASNVSTFSRMAD